MPDTNQKLDPVQFGAMQADVGHLKRAVDDLDAKIDRHNSRLYDKLDQIVGSQHTTPCNTLKELQTRGTSTWKTLVIIGAFVVGIVGIAGGIVAIIKALS